MKNKDVLALAFAAAGVIIQLLALVVLCLK